MKRLIGLASAAVMMALAVVAGAADSLSIKQIMVKQHKGARAPMGRLKAALKADSPKWKEVQALSNEFAALGAGLPKQAPPRGDSAAYERLAIAYNEDSKELEAAAQAEDKAKATAALNKLGASCKACHRAHRRK